MTATLLHVSDPHLTDDPSVRRLTAVLDLPRARRPDAVIATGDIADHGRPGEYESFAKAMATRPPWLAVPGNHDDPDPLRTVLRQDRCPVLDVAAVRVIGLDVTVPGAGHGFLRADSAREAVARAEGARHVVLAFHQPPITTGHALADGILLTNRDALAELVRRLSRVVAILCGHVHLPLAATFAGTPVLCAPGIASTPVLDRQDRLVLDRDTPPGVAVHRIDDDGTVTTVFQRSR